MSADELTEGMVTLSSALDVADELLERFTNPAGYEPWKETGKRSGKTARGNWRRKQGKKIKPMKRLRDYRNHLVHGRIMPSIEIDSYPGMGMRATTLTGEK